MVALTTGVMFLLSMSGCGEFYKGGPRMRRPPMKQSATAESLGNTAVALPDKSQCVA
jgi:hypothetical protein